MTLPEGTITFLRSDIEGSMELVRALGARYDELNAEHAALMRAAIEQEGGQVVRTEGDAFFAVFTEAAAAARAAVAIQSAMAGHDWPAGHPVRVRIGIHSGVAIRAGDDYGGFEVNRAARIAAVGWGGQIIISDTARALLDDGLDHDWSVRSLGSYRLQGIPEPQRLFQLDVAGLTGSFPTLRGGDGPAQHIPTQARTFVGRQAELKALDGLFDGTRLLTLTGPGGTGKTTLALQLARRRAGEFSDGAWFVDLQAVRDPDLVRPSIATSLQIFDGPAGTAADRLTSFVAERAMLIVIDNFEQVIDAAPHVGDLVAASPQSMVVVTSRIPLRLAAEQEFPVEPLDWKPTATDDEGEAVRLFVERARRVRPGLEVDAAAMDVVRDICRSVDGLPLAVELCASRVAALPVVTIRDRLAARLPLPGTGPRDLPTRQRTIEDTVAWSHELLEVPLKALFARLAVFRESFDHEQADIVCGPAEEIGIDVLDGLVQLAEHSLLMHVDDAAGGVRFRMLETIRSFAWDRLIESGQVGDLQDRHARAYVGLAEDVAPELEELDARRSRARLEADDANLRAALDRAFEIGDVRLFQVGVAKSWRYWQLTGRLAEGRARTEAALALSSALSPEYVRVVAAAASIAYWQGEFATARDGYERQLALAQELGIDSEIADAWFSLVYVYNFSGDLDAGERAEAAALQAFSELGDQHGLDNLTVARATTLIPAAFAESELLLSELEARLAAAELLDDESAKVACMATRAAVQLLRGDGAEAVDSAVSAMRTGSAFGHEGDAVMMLPAVILFAAAHDRPRIAVIALGAFAATRLRLGAISTDPFEGYGAPDPTERLRASMGDEAFRAALDHGGRMALADVIDLIETALTPVFDPSTALGQEALNG